MFEDTIKTLPEPESSESALDLLESGNAVEDEGNSTQPLALIEGRKLTKEEKADADRRYTEKIKKFKQQRSQVLESLLYRVQRSVELGDEETAAMVQAVIDGWRAERYAAEAESHEAERRLRLERREDRYRVRMAVLGKGGGGRRQRRAVRMYDEAMTGGPADRLMFAHSGAFLAKRRAGRPRRRIW